jgi:putative CRISPR-associated protein (TIGR02619 family)
MQKPLFVLSPCGTSLLNHNANNDEKDLLRRHANSVTIDGADLAALQPLLQRVGERLRAANSVEASIISAEINSIDKLYAHEKPSASDCHYLLATDTWLGEETANLVAAWLRQSGIANVQVYRHKDLKTNDLEQFQSSLADLVKWVSEVPGNYQNNGYRVIFNLTGGFKGVQGFLQGIANFYADEAVYLFESSNRLMRIPRLPIRLDAIEHLAQHSDDLRRLSLGLAPQGSLESIPETLLLHIDGEPMLSPWGEIYWDQARKEIYAKGLQPTPDARLIRYSDRLADQVAAVASDRRRLVNERIDDLLRYFRSSGQNNPKRLDFKQLRNPKAKPPSTHEMDAWSDQDARRLFGHYEGATFVIDSLDLGLH